MCKATADIRHFAYPRRLYSGFVCNTPMAPSLKTRAFSFIFLKIGNGIAKFMFSCPNSIEWAQNKSSDLTKNYVFWPAAVLSL